MARDHSSYSFWLKTSGDDLDARPGLPGDGDADVCIVGAGYTGLWTAYYLARLDPSLRVTVVEKEIAGFGASGRNGGWCSALFAAKRDKIAASHGRPAAIAMQRAMFETVDEVGRAAGDEGIDCHFAKGGTLTVATRRAHLDRIRADIEEEREWGFTDDDYAFLGPRETNERVRVSGCLGAGYTRHCAALHPARLARGLARAAERRGVRLYEGTTALEIAPHEVVTDRGRVKADVIVRATEGYTPLLPRHKRILIPVYSLMIATEPLPDETWQQLGWEQRETLTDGRHLIIYAQRTADGRIAFGGRGAPYHFGSRVADRFDRDPAVFAELQSVLTSLFPALSSARVTHRWGGCLGIPRDWHSSVGLNRSTGLAWAGGYVGDGVSTSNLAGRTLADLILERDTDLTRLPWVGHRSRRWEPEPLRWLGVNLSLKLMSGADRAEARTGRPSRRAKFVQRLTGF